MDKSSLEYIELKHYRLIRAIIENGTVSGAAKELFMSQSAASRQLSALEYFVGNPVFSRINKRMIPTAIGQLLNELANEIESRINKTEMVINNMLSGVGGNIGIGSLCMHSYGWLSKFVMQVRKDYPNFSFSFYNVTDTMDLFEATVDFIVTDMPFVDKRITVTPLFSGELVVVVSENHEIASRDWVGLEELTGENVFYYFSEISQIYRYYIANMEVKFKRRFSRAPHLEAALSMVRAGMGITFMPRWALSDDDTSLVGIRLYKTGYPMVWNLMALPSTLPSQRFITDELVKFTKKFNKIHKRS